MLSIAIASLLAASAVQSASIRHLQSRQQQSTGNLTQEYNAFVQQFEAATFVENVYNSSFYQTPSNFSESLAPGEVLKVERVSNTSLSSQYGYPAGLTLYRMMYTSSNVRNKTVPATAFVLQPYVPTNRTVAWTHGTSGITRDCAPSNYRGLWYDWDGPYMLATQGYNVVGTDYAGEGTDVEFDYVCGASHASDAAYSIVAARKALPFLNIDEWAVIGHSEGGLSAWATSEREAHSPTPGFLGGVSLAPSMDPVEINIRAFATNESRQALTESGSVFYPVFFLEVIRRLFPSLQLSEYLTSTGLELLNLNLGGGCYVAAATFFPTFTLEQVWRNYTAFESPQASEWQALTGTTGKGKLVKPHLVVQGSADEAVSYPVNRDTFDNHCKMYGDDSPIQLSIYPGLRHEPVIMTSLQQWWAFLNDLFTHQKPSNFAYCKTTTQGSLEMPVNRQENYMTTYAATSQ